MFSSQVYTLKKFIRKILLWINLSAALLLILSYLFVYVPPDRFWEGSVFGLAYPIFLWINILFVIFWAIFKPRYLILSLFVIFIGWGHISKYVQIGNKSDNSGGIHIVSYNVRAFDEFGDNAAKTTADSIIAFFNKKSPDIICLQEVKLRSPQIFNLFELKQKYDFASHYQYALTTDYGGIVTMTKYPIVNMGEIRFVNSGNMAIFTDVAIGPDTLRIFNLHLQSFRIEPVDYPVIESPRLTEPADRKKIRQMGGKFKRAVKMRAEQARIVSENIERSPYPVLVCGDFNDTPFSYTYHEVRGNLRDAFTESGNGFDHTYIGKLPSYRIDYIMHSEGFQAFDFKPEHIYFSDHLPVSCSLVKK